MSFKIALTPNTHYSLYALMVKRSILYIHAPFGLLMLCCVLFRFFSSSSLQQKYADGTFGVWLKSSNEKNAKKIEIDFRLENQNLRGVLVYNPDLFLKIYIYK